MKKKLFLSAIILAGISTLMFSQDSTNVVITHVSDVPVLEFLKLNMWKFILLGFLCLETWLGQTGVIKEGSFIALVVNMIGKAFFKKADIVKSKVQNREVYQAKRREKSLNSKYRLLILVAMLSIAGLSASAQSPWQDFFKPVTVNRVYDQLALRADQGATDESNVWLFRPAAALTAVAIDLSEKPAVNKSLSSVGIGISYGKFSDIENKAYCTYSINALLLTAIEIGGTQSTTIGGALTVDVFNKLIGGGVGYINNSFMLLTTLSYSF